MDLIEALKSRISANKFDTEGTLGRDEIRELVTLASEAPSAFNVQHWRFVAVTEKEDKERLRSVAYNQQKVADAAVTFIVLGDLRAHEKAAEINRRAVEAGVYTQEIADRMTGMTAGMYENERAARDEAIRSGGLVSMALMLAARARGLVSGPMIGFDAEGVKREFNISDRYLPVMMITVGYEAEGNWPRKPRLAVDEILAFDEGREF
jgi:nitroreductase